MNAKKTLLIGCGFAWSGRKLKRHPDWACTLVVPHLVGWTRAVVTVAMLTALASVSIAGQDGTTLEGQPASRQSGATEGTPRGAELTDDQIAVLVHVVREEAEKLSANAVPVCIIKGNFHVLGKGTKAKIQLSGNGLRLTGRVTLKGARFGLGSPTALLYDDGDMICNVGSTPLQFHGTKLQEGEYAIARRGTLKKRGIVEKLVEQQGEDSQPKSKGGGKARALDDTVGKSEGGEAILKEATDKAHQMGGRPVYAQWNPGTGFWEFLYEENNRGTVTEVLGGMSMDWILTSERAIVRDGDMLINLSNKLLNIGGVVLGKGECVLREGTILKLTKGERGDLPKAGQSLSEDAQTRESKSILPAYAHELDGKNPVRIRNPNARLLSRCLSRFCFV
ncbi:MAG: hypothetical protein HQ559_04445 [Lentisphaerae bacterium]|nr:hypothetical protein [Lentisphaerota bacterium]